MQRIMTGRTITWLVAAVLFALVPLAGVLGALSPLLSMLAIVMSAGVMLLLHVTNASAVRNVALAVCAAIIMYPVFLPRQSGETSVAFGGDFGLRAQVQGVIVVGLAAIAAWLWLSTPGAVMALTRKPVNLFTCYVGVVLLSLLYTPDKGWATYAAVKLVEAFLIVTVLAVLVQNTAQLRRVIDAMLVGVAVVMIAYWVDIISGNYFIDSTARIRTTWIHPNSASVIAFAFTSIMLARFFTAPSRSAARMATVLTGFGIATGFMAGGKTAFAGGAIAAALTIAVIMSRQTKQSKMGRIFLVVLGLAVIVGGGIVFNVGIFAHIRAYQANEYLDPTNLTGRLPVWTAAIREGMAYPIWGHGYMATFAIGLGHGQRWVAYQAHNSFVQTFFDLGLVGLVTIIAVYAGAWISVARQVMAFRPSDERWRLSVELLAGLTVLTVDSFTEDTFGGIFEPRSMVFMLIVFAIYQNVAVRSTVPQSIASAALDSRIEYAQR